MRNRRRFVVHRVCPLEPHWLSISTQVHVLSNLIWHILTVTLLFVSHRFLLTSCRIRLRDTTFLFRADLAPCSRVHWWLSSFRRVSVYMTRCSIWQQLWHIFNWPGVFCDLVFEQIVIVLPHLLASLFQLGSLH